MPRQRTLLVFILALALLPLATGNPQRFKAGEPKHVKTINPKIGVHTRLTDEVEEWKIKRTMEMVREMGASWVVEYFPWAYMEPSKNQFGWTHAEMVSEYAYAEGLTLIARIDYVPAWARPKETTSSYLGPERYADFGDFVYAFVRHFKNRIKYYIIWNEPNLTIAWGFRQVDPVAYTQLLKTAYLRAKEAWPGATILAAGLAPTLESPGSPNGLNDLLYLQQMYDAGARPYFDGMAIHAYGWKTSPDQEAAPDRLNFARAELIHQVMERNGDGTKPCFITEGGWNDHPRWTKAVRPAQRTEYTVRAYQKALEEWPWCRSVALWAFRFPKPTRSYNDYFAFVNADFTPRPVYVETANYARGQR
ncbi:MAG: hypothetical protein AB1566_04315 [Chloroflexota bacterium]